jgi:cell wall-associated NlpC family hydrolase
MGPLAGCVGVILAGCSSTRQASNLPPNAPRATPPTRMAEPSRTQSQRNDLALFAMSLLDTRYTWGGRGPATGFDCSGLVSHVYREAVGIPVKGTSAELGRQSRPIDRSQLQPGDLVFFNTLGTRHSHVGVYVGNNKFVHASNPRTGVRMDALSNRYYAQRFEGAQTLLD